MFLQYLEDSFIYSRSVWLIVRLFYLLTENEIVTFFDKNLIHTRLGCATVLSNNYYTFYTKHNNVFSVNFFLQHQMNIRAIGYLCCDLSSE